MYLLPFSCFHLLGTFFESCICIAVTMIPDEISNYIQLYRTFCSQDTNPERVLLVESLNLLYLLVSNNLSAFHAEVNIEFDNDFQLELLPDEKLTNPMIQFSVHIEGYLTTGRYNRIQECMQNLPNPIFSHLMDYLLESILEDIESCIEVSYKQLSLQEYCQTVNWKGTVEEAAAYIAQNHVIVLMM